MIQKKGDSAMAQNFRAKCLPVLIGSLPLDDHGKAIKLVLKYTPEIPIWVQLPVFKEEGMIAQFLPGFPSIAIENDKVFINTADENFDENLLKFYEDYMAVIEKETDLYNSRFVLQPDTAGGFFALFDHIHTLSTPLNAVKGQITGPITFCTGLKDQNGRAIFYNDQVKDAAVKLLALKAAWQARRLSTLGCPVIIFIDEPALAGFGSSEFISITREEITMCLTEVIEAIHGEGGLAGIHVCANTDWAMVLESSVDIVNFDAYSYFDKFILYPDQIVKFFKSGCILAWGIVPTLNAEDIERETTDSLLAKWENRSRKIEELGIARSDILAQSLITPSCGAGSMRVDHAIKVLQITRQISENLRKQI
jgi:methionine synthase II (cobalamin-independent)